MVPERMCTCINVMVAENGRIMRDCGLKIIMEKSRGDGSNPELIPGQVQKDRMN